MASTRFLDRSARVLWSRVVMKRTRERRGLHRATAALGGLSAAVIVFFVLKGAALAAGVSLPQGAGLAFWLAGADPVASAFGATLQPLFAGRV